MCCAGYLAERRVGAQSPPFNSGSNGSDGALNLTTPGTIIFNPKDTSLFPTPLDPDGDNIYHFTTINIGSGVTVKLTGHFLSGPVFWLASGPVTINGVIDLSGESGRSQTNISSERVPSVAGSGGFGGGIGGRFSSPNPPLPGNGPGGGQAETTNSPQSNAGGGRFTGNQFLVPLIGGSGGGGSGCSCGETFGSGGGAGAGAILIASSNGITMNGGQILANGGNGPGSGCACGPGPGSGGAIRLVASTVTLNQGSAARALGGVGIANATDGIIRVEAFNVVINSGGFFPPRLQSLPFSLLLPTSPAPSVRVLSVNGVPINSNPFTFPDALINTASPVTVNIEARNVPTGTIPRLLVFSETGPDQTLNCSPLAGSLALSTSTATVTFPTGGSRGFVKAIW